MRLTTAAISMVALFALAVACGADPESPPAASTATTATSATATAPQAEACRFEDAAERVVAASALVVTPDGYGSAFHIGDGRFVTAEHVVTGFTTVHLQTDEFDVEARVVGVEARADVALLEVTDAGVRALAALEWFDGDRVRPGQSVGAAGYPVDVEGSAAVTRGTVSRVTSEEGGLRVIQTDAAINSGNSGGALFDECGAVIGVVVSKWNEAGVEGVAYATSYDSAQISLAAAEPPTSGRPLVQAGAFGDGTYRVGTEIEPGRYRNSDSSAYCYWERLSGFRPSPDGIGYVVDDVIDVGLSFDIQTVDVQPSDAGFYALDCGTWTLVAEGAPPAPANGGGGAPQRTFGDGTHRVGADISPGRYRNSDSSAWCYWERLSGFEESGGLGYADADVIASGLSFGIQTVDVHPSDAGFFALDCGTWTRVEAVGAGPSAGQPSLADGTHVVGVDIAPGRYRNSDSSDLCYWERLSGFRPSSILGHDPRDVITFGISFEIQTVDIEPADAGFFALDCGVWSPVTD